ncbi:tetratricopeptide repeat protein [Pseudanabaena sp. PCC 6802]|uniref:tetratricopeptide repeat protein n=1 Tax=Pseudanabaena sp. PCC 6802 TaxID=118173 RepID=UPI0003600095|nr:tetratricopeptide repeat protein [Pseudanabaena sp. PCC 6802]
MPKRTTKQWIINIVLIITTLSFLGISIAPLLGGILAPQQAANKPTTTQTSEKEKLKIQIEGFEAVLKREPKNRTALENLAILRIQAGDLKGAIEPLQTLADINPDIADYRLKLAETHLRLKQRDLAIAEYRKILSTKPGELRALDSLIGLELKDKRPEAAIGLLKETIAAADTVNKIQPDSIDKTTVTLMLGDVYLNQKRYEEAKDVFDKLAKQETKDFRPLVGQAQVARAQGDETKASSLFTKAAELAPPQYKDNINKLAAKPPESTTNVAPKPDTTDPKEKTDNKPDKKN